MVEFLIIILSCCIGCFLGNFLFKLYEAFKFKKSILRRNFFKDTDFDFFSDNNDKSITDINIEDIKEE